MTITDVKGYPTEGGGVDRIDIEGDSPHLDKLEVSLEVTGKQLKRSVTVRKDRTWTARFKASDGVDLLGFNCGTLVKAGASSKGDEPQHVVWTGCVRCADDDAEQGADAQGVSSADEPAGADAASGGQPARVDGEPVEGAEEPIVLVRRGEGGGDQAVVTVTVGRPSVDQEERQGPRTTRRPPNDRKRTRRRDSKGVEQGDSQREPEHHEPEYQGGDDETPRERSEGIVQRRSRDDMRPARHPEYDPEYDEEPRSRREAPHDDEWEDSEQREDLGYADEPRRRDARDEREDRDRRRAEPRRDDRDRGQERDRPDRRGRHEDRERDEESRPGREPASWPIGSAVLIATALFLLSIAAQAYPMMVGLATAVVVPTWAFVLAGYTPASWARWAGAGVGLAALVIPGSMAFVDFIEADVYLVASGVAALGIAIAAGLLFFRTGEDDEDEDREG